MLLLRKFERKLKELKQFINSLLDFLFDFAKDDRLALSNHFGIALCKVQPRGLALFQLQVHQIHLFPLLDSDKCE